MTVSLARAAAVLVLASSIAGCKPPAPDAAPDAAAAVAGRGGSAQSDRNTRLLDAAGGFETLTETALTQPFTALTATRQAAVDRAATVRSLLTAEQTTRLDALADALDAALAGQDRTATAIAAVETYRVLVSAQDGTAKVPVDVSLLDYAGFKYDTIVQAQPIDWTGMATDVGYAREVWTRLSPDVSSQALVGAFESSLAGMETAVRERNPVAARVAVSTELALVDALEEHFSARP
jgi:hypothetical protein